MQEHNEVLLTKELLTQVLTYLSVRLYDRFRTTVRIVVHGGAVMVLHPSLSCRKSTRDVDYNHRSFVTYWAKRGVQDAGVRLSLCIEETARAFTLGADWMNAHADVALPMARDVNGQLTDPIYEDAMTKPNIATNIVFESQGLVLVAVSWSWAVALKLIRYQKDDPNDIAAILKLGTQMRGCKWTVEVFEGWLNKFCSPMGYKYYPPQELAKNRAKMQDAIKRAQQLNWGLAATVYQPPPTLVPWWYQQQAQHTAPGLTRFSLMTEGISEHQQRSSSQDRLASTRSRTRSFSSSSSVHTHASSYGSRTSSSHSSSRMPVPAMPVPPIPAPPITTAPVPPPSVPPPSYYHNAPPRRRHVSMSAPPHSAPPAVPTVPYVYAQQSISRRSSPAAQPPPPAMMSTQASSISPPRVEKLPPGFVPTHFVPRVHHQAVHRVAMVG